MKRASLILITFYQAVLSPDKGFIPFILGKRRQVCIYHPTCSEYAKEAIEKYGFLEGWALALKRIGRCNPLNEPRVDLVP